MDLTLIRHSRSTTNAQNLISGPGFDAPLSPDGVAYARAVSEVFDEQKFDAVFASPLQRALETAEILTKGKREIATDPRVEEMHFGQWESQDPDPLRLQYPDAFDYMGMLNKNFSQYAHEAESYDDLVHRVADFVADLKQDYPDKKVLVVCHGLTIRGFFAAIFHAEMDSFVNVGNVTVNEVHLDENEGFSPRLYSFNRELVSADDFFNR